MEQLYKLVYTDAPKGTLGAEPIRRLTVAQCEDYERMGRGGQKSRREEDGVLTTIREFLGAESSLIAEARFVGRWLDEPCIADVLCGLSVYCSGRALVGFYAPARLATRRPAYVVSTDTGLRLVQSA